MSSISPIKTALMPLSLGTLWYKTMSSTTETAFLNTLTQGSAFYCVWALYNRYLDGNKNELGHVSTGLMLLATYSRRRWAMLVANALLVANFAVPAFLVLKIPTSKLVRILKRVSVDEDPGAAWWAVIFKSYLALSAVFWSLTLYRIGREQYATKSQ